jgi:hypothetical protein
VSKAGSVGPVMVPRAQQDPVGEIGLPAAAPRRLVVGLAPGGGQIASAGPAVPVPDAAAALAGAGMYIGSTPSTRSSAALSSPAHRTTG